MKKKKEFYFFEKNEKEYDNNYKRVVDLQKKCIAHLIKIDHGNQSAIFPLRPSIMDPSKAQQVQTRKNFSSLYYIEAINV